MIDTGNGYELELNGDPYFRFFRGSDGKLEKLIEVVGGREYTIVYDGASGAPQERSSFGRGSVATFIERPTARSASHGRWRDGHL